MDAGLAIHGWRATTIFLELNQNNRFGTEQKNNLFVYHTQITQFADRDCGNTHERKSNEFVNS